jgi:endogenous inhibitor of DNA gyrase (YacG/DUF329 family)
MIRFRCEQCSHSISIQNEHAGRQGKCPGCGSVITVPAESTLLAFCCQHCDEKISTLRTYAGKKGKCPNCERPLVIPKEAAHASSEQMPLASAAKLNEEAVSGLSREERQILGGETRDDEAEQTARRRFLWPVDIFLYPANASGLIHIAIFVIVPILLKLLHRFFLSGARHYGGLLILAFYVFLIGYILSYLAECIRDSARGELRASNSPSAISGRDEILGQCVVWLACYAFFFGPATFYGGYVHFREVETNNVILGLLLAYGIFFFPMGILAAAMFDSVNGLNPILLICSIASTFLQYCGLVIFLACLAFLRVGLSMLSFGRRWGILADVVPNLLLIWLLLVAVHLIGRFYWRYQEKLNWEV